MAQRDGRGAHRIIEPYLGLGQRLERARAKRLGNVLRAAPGAAHHQDRYRMTTHDLRDGPYAAHAFELHVHRDEVRSQLRKCAERLLP
jgi:hypothetical protein